VDTRGSDCGFFRAKHFCCRTATAIAFFRCGEFSPSLGKVHWTEFLSSHYLGILVMSSAKALATLAPVKALATLASVAAVVCCLFAFGWVGLALLGY
jgi:hypothetical protein